jgi:V8-like Glu-specific endopeptidase
MIRITLLVLFIVTTANGWSQQSCSGFAPAREINYGNETVAEPYSLVCHLATHRKTKFFGRHKTNLSTFTFLTPRILIGAGHALKEKGSLIESITIKVYAHEEDGNERFLYELYYARKDLVLSKPFSGGGNANDCGLIILPGAVAKRWVAFPELQVAEAAKEHTDSIRLMGYPSGKTNQHNGKKLWERSIAITRTTINGGLIYYPCVETYVGDSGGPVWYMEKEKLYLIGTHVGRNKKNFNSVWAECFTEEKLKTLRDWISRYPS